MNADDGLSTCLTFEEADNWRQELHCMVCDETPSLSKQIRLGEKGEDDDEIEPERNSITSYDVALCMSNDLLLFLTHNKLELCSMLQHCYLGSAKLNHAKMMKLSSILSYFNKP